MIIIIRALSPNKEKKKKKAKEKKEKKERPKKERPNKKRERPKKRKAQKKGGQCYYPFPHVCFKVTPCSSYRESHMLSLSYTSGNFSL